MGDGCVLSSPVIPHPPFHLHLNINHHPFSPPWEMGIGCYAALAKKKHKNSKKITYTVFAFELIFL
jgi:hypothetical protein